MNMYKEQAQQLELLTVKEGSSKKRPAKRVNIVSLKMVKDSSILYKNRAIRSPEDGYNLFKQFLGELDREYFVVMCLDVKNQPTAMNVCHIGSLNASLVHPREIMKSHMLLQSLFIMTIRLVEADNIMGIELLDHLVIGSDRFVSLKENGYI